VRFSANGRVDGAAEILELFTRHASPSLDESAAAAISAAVRRISTDENTKRLEVAYAELRAHWFTGLTAAELVRGTRGLLGNLEWTLCGRRAELRAICQAALELTDDQARELLDALLLEEDRTRQEDLCTVLGEALAIPGPDPSPLTQYARDRSRRELAGLPARRRGDGSRPLPMLFVNTLYSARVGGGELRAALPEDVPTELWSDPDGLMPLLTPAALAGQPAAVATLDNILTASPGAALSVREVKVRKGVLGRLREAAFQGIPAALDHLIDHADATGDVTVVCAVLGRPGTARVHPLANHRDRLDRLRHRLVTSADRAVIASGHKLWRVLVEHNLGTPPAPGDIVAALDHRPSYPTLIGLFELTNACLRSGRWSGQDVTLLIGALTPYTEQRLARRAGDEENSAPRQDLGDKEDVESAKRAATTEMWARRLVIGLYARHMPLGDSAIHQRNHVNTVLALINDAHYDLEDVAELDAFTACMTEVGRLVERLDDPATTVDIVLDTAARLDNRQPEATRWRRRTAQAWHPAIASAVAEAAQLECRRLIDGLLNTDRQMARLAVAACVEHIRPIPGWLQELAPEMPPEVHKRMREVLNRNARDGSPRPLDELYALSVASNHPPPAPTGAG
jgi:hypothetical protein